MISEIFDPYEKLSCFIRKAIDHLSIFCIENNSKCCFFIGYQKIEFDQITENLPEYEIKPLMDDQFLTVKKIIKNKEELYFLYIPYTSEKSQETIYNYKISTIILYLIKNIKAIQSHYIINRISDEDQFLKQDICTHITLSNEQNQYIYWIDLYHRYITCDNQQILQYIQNKYYKQEFESPFQLRSLQYIQEEVDEFLSKLKIKEQLITLQKNLDICSQFPRNTKEFHFVLTNMIQSLNQKFETNKDNSQIESIKSIAQTINKFGLSLNSRLMQIQNENYQSVLDFCQLLGVKLEEIQFSFKLDFEKFEKISQYFNNDWFETIDWEAQQVLSIQQQISYLTLYHEIVYIEEEQNNFDFDLILQTIQQPFEIKPTQTAVFMFGLTKAGKSTLTSIIENPNNLCRELENFQMVYKKNTNKNQFSINNSGLSNNQRLIEMLEVNELVFFDCPGLNDTDEQFRIMNFRNILSQVSLANNPIFIMIINSQDESTFLQNFKETIEYFSLFSGNTFTKQEFTPIFILTKIEVHYIQGKQLSFINSLYEEQQQIFRKNDFIPLKEHLIKFFDSFRQNRVLYFPHVRYENQFDFQTFREKIFQTVHQAKVDQKQLQLDLDIDLQNSFDKTFVRLQDILDLRANLTINFVIQKAINTILLEKNQTLKEKLENVKNFINLLNEILQFSFYETIIIIEQWVMNHYNVLTFDQYRFQSYKNAHLIFQFQLEDKIKNYTQKLKDIQKKIIGLQNIEYSKQAAKMFAFAVLVGGISLSGNFGQVVAFMLYACVKGSLLDKTSIVSRFLYTPVQKLNYQLKQQFETVKARKPE